VCMCMCAYSFLHLTSKTTRHHTGLLKRMHGASLCACMRACVGVRVCMHVFCLRFANTCSVKLWPYVATR
jgi:hypothetical protein